jgi:hypothetical protein
MDGDSVGGAAVVLGELDPEVLEPPQAVRAITPEPTNSASAMNVAVRKLRALTMTLLLPPDPGACGGAPRRTKTGLRAGLTSGSPPVNGGRVRAAGGSAPPNNASLDGPEGAVFT